MSMCIAAGPRPGVARTDEPAAAYGSPWRPDRAEGECGTVLLADADEEGRTVCGVVLRGAGYVVLEAETGEEAIRLAHARRPDAIVLGPVLRGVDAMRALAVLHEHPATAPIPVVVLGADSGGDHERRARAAGCAAWLPAPYPPSRVVDTVRALTPALQAQGALRAM